MNNTENENRNQTRGGAPVWQVALLMLLSAAFAATAVLFVFAGGLTKYRIVDSSKDDGSALIPDLIDNIEKYYYFSDELPDKEELVNAAAHGLVTAVGDPYGAYYSDEEYEEFRGTLNGNYKGIGVLISQHEQGAYVQRAYENNPAADAGVKDGDIITAVDGSSVAGMDLNAISDLITGEGGTLVTLTVERDGQKLNITVTRGDVYVRRVYSETLASGIGYIRIESFTGSAASEFDEALAALLESGIPSLIIDIRNDPGGTLDVVIAIADRILGDCTITTLEGKLVDPPKVYTSTAEKSLSIPFAVLVNGNSASASEIFASAVQDNRAGTLVGTNTYGKGIVQTSWAIPSGGYIKLTIDVYKTPNGRMIHGVGVAPDVTVEQDPDIEGWDLFFIMRDMRDRDLQLKAAEELLLGSAG